MPHAHVHRRASSIRRALMPALAFSVLPLGTAFAQSIPYVRVTRDGTEIRALRQTDDVRMTAPKGTVMEVVYIEGDRYVHRDSNWYWVLLPQDPWATRPAGWVRGDAVEDAPPPAPVSTPRANRIDVPQAQEARNEPRIEPRLTTMPEPVSVSVAEVPTTPPVYSDVVLNFEFGRSELTEEAKDKLASAIAIQKPSARVSVALEGYADWVGTEAYNEKLGLDRAETVRRYLAEQLRIPASRISVVSYGEGNPAAPNTTRAGRALNRRVVIKVGA